MNKTELITFLRDPNKLSSSQLEELEEIVDENPYFLSARLLLAKAGKESKHPKAKKFVASAAIYSTDRILLKKYLNGNLFFLSEPPKASEEEPIETKAQEPGKVAIQNKPVEPATKQATTEPKPTVKEEKPEKKEEVKPAEPTPAKETAKEKPAAREDKRPSALKERESRPQPEVPDLPSGDLDSMLEELQRDMENLKSSREKFAKVQEKIEEDDAVSAALQKASGKSVEATTEAPIEVKSTSEETPPTLKEEEPGADKIDEEVKKSSEEITRQVLEAAKKAKEEVAKEDSAEQAKAEAEPEEKKEETEKAEDKSQEKSDDNERAERAIREPRFSRFATRSYIKPPEDIDTSKFLDDEKPSKKSEATGQGTSEEDDGKEKIKLPDLSKARPVERRSKRKSSAKKEEGSEKEEKPKKEEDASKKETAKKEPAKKSTTKASEKKSTTSKAKKTATKKESTKKTTKAKSSKTKSTKTKDEKKDDDKSDRKSQQDLIDKFIKESPSIKYQRKDEPSAEDLAETSSSWDPNLASEYLAEIYLYQGNKKRAIEIYEALSLKYPEKKSYFADLISKID